jgi:hypothetical protein
MGPVPTIAPAWLNSGILALGAIAVIRLVVIKFKTLVERSPEKAKASLIRWQARRGRTVIESAHWEEPQMTREEQAVVIWPVLAFAARMQRVLTYGEVADLTGILARAQSDPLHLIHLYCERKHYPLLNSIVVDQVTGFPGGEFPKPMTELEFLVERARVFTYGWSAKDKPRSEDFEASQSATA